MAWGSGRQANPHPEKRPESRWRHASRFGSSSSVAGFAPGAGRFFTRNEGSATDRGARRMVRSAPILAMRARIWFRNDFSRGAGARRKNDLPWRRSPRDHCGSLSFFEHPMLFSEGKIGSFRTLYSNGSCVELYRAGITRLLDRTGGRRLGPWAPTRREFGDASSARHEGRRVSSTGDRPGTRIHSLGGGAGGKKEKRRGTILARTVDDMLGLSAHTLTRPCSRSSTSVFGCFDYAERAQEFFDSMNFPVCGQFSEEQLSGDPE